MGGSFWRDAAEFAPILIKRGGDYGVDHHLRPYFVTVLGLVWALMRRPHQNSVAV